MRKIPNYIDDYYKRHAVLRKKSGNRTPKENAEMVHINKAVANLEKAWKQLAVPLHSILKPKN